MKFQSCFQRFSGENLLLSLRGSGLPGINLVGLWMKGVFEGKAALHVYGLDDLLG